MGQKDIAEKLLADYNDVFADIVNGLLFDGRPVVKEDELEDTNVVSQYKADGGELHEQTRDIAKIWKKCGIQIAFIGMENQTAMDSRMPLRIISYDGASYKSQLLDKTPPRPVVTLVLYFGETPWDEPRSLFDCFEVSEELKPFVNDYKINVFEIARLNMEQVSKFKSDFKIVADFFVQQRLNKEYKPSADKIKHVDEILKLLAVLSRDKRFKEVDVEVFKRRENDNGGVTMCEVLDKVENRGIAIGMERGISIGKEQGISIGKEQGIFIGTERGISIGLERKSIEVARNLLNMGLSPEQVSQGVNLPFERVLAIKQEEENC